MIQVKALSRTARNIDELCGKPPGSFKKFIKEQNAELIGNPIFVESANSGTSRVPIINKPGTRLTISGVQAMNNKPDWLTPPSMPPLIMDLVEFWIRRIAVIRGRSP